MVRRYGANPLVMASFSINTSAFREPRARTRSQSTTEGNELVLKAWNPKDRPFRFDSVSGYGAEEALPQILRHVVVFCAS